MTLLEQLDRIAAGDVITNEELVSAATQAADIFRTLEKREDVMREAVGAALKNAAHMVTTMGGVVSVGG